MEEFIDYPTRDSVKILTVLSLVVYNIHVQKISIKYFDGLLQVHNYNRVLRSDNVDLTFCCEFCETTL